MAYETEEPLTKHDFSDLEKLVWKSLRMVLPFVALFMVIGYWFPYAFIVAGLFMIPLFMGLNNVKKIKKGNVKTVLRGFVTDRFQINIPRRTSRDFYISVGDRKFLVDYSMYKKFKPGEMVEIHFINQAGTVMGVNTHTYLILSKKIIPVAEVESKNGNNRPVWNGHDK